MLRNSFALVLLLTACAGLAYGDGPFPPHRIAGNTYYVGSKDLATYLIKSNEGHIVINSGFDETVPLIRDAVEKLGFQMRDIKIILASHAHSDHVAGHARLKELTGAKVYVMEGDDQVIAKGGEGQYLYTTDRWKPCEVDKVLKDGEEVKLSDVTLIARRTPGHTRGCTTWTWQVSDFDRKLDVVVIGSPNVNPGYQLVANADYPEIADDFAQTFKTLKSLKCDIFLGAHGDYYGLPAKYEKLKQNAANPFIDPQGYSDYVDLKHKAFEKTLSDQKQAATGPVKHSFFIAGPTFTGIIDENDQEVWNANAPAARDGYVLPSGNVLIAWSEEVKELTRDHKTVFHYRRSEENREIGTVQRLDSGNTLVTELGPRPRLLEIDAAGKIVVDCPLAPETDNAHMQTRMARKLASGNYLVPHLLAFKVKEYTPAGKVVQEFPTDLEQLGGRQAENWPFTAIRLPNGNTLVNLTHGNKTVEFNPAGEVVWKVGNEDFPDLKPFADPCGGQRLPNGNTVIASYGSTGDIKVFEVTRDKKIVWKYTGKHRAHEIQILTTNGKPIEGAPLK